MERSRDLSTHTVFHQCHFQCLCFRLNDRMSMPTLASVACPVLRSVDALPVQNRRARREKARRVAAGLPPAPLRPAATA